jgi:hypothetical protein
VSPRLPSPIAKALPWHTVVATLFKALIDFDLAIWLDPNFEDAYINRGIILYRMREFDFAFDDVVRALHIESSHRIEQPPLPKPSPLLNKDYKAAP